MVSSGGFPIKNKNSPKEKFFQCKLSPDYNFILAAMNHDHGRKVHGTKLYAEKNPHSHYSHKTDVKNNKTNLLSILPSANSPE